MLLPRMTGFGGQKGGALIQQDLDPCSRKGYQDTSFCSTQVHTKEKHGALILDFQPQQLTKPTSLWQLTYTLQEDRRQTHSRWETTASVTFGLRSLKHHSVDYFLADLKPDQSPFLLQHGGPISPLHDSNISRDALIFRWVERCQCRAVGKAMPIQIVLIVFDLFNFGLAFSTISFAAFLSKFLAPPCLALLHSDLKYHSPTITNQNCISWEWIVRGQSWSPNTLYFWHLAPTMNSPGPRGGPRGRNWGICFSLAVVWA